MAPMNKKGIAEETEIQRRTREGFERLAERKFDDFCAIILDLVKQAETKTDAHEKQVWRIYAGLLAHCLLCWRPAMRDVFGPLDSEAAKILVTLPDAEQEEFFVFSQRIEDNTNDDIAGLGMYLHYVLLVATGDYEHAIPVLEDSIQLREPLSSAMVALEMLKHEKKRFKKDQIKELLLIGIEKVQPIALECATSDQCKGMFDEEIFLVLQMQLTELYEANGGKKGGVLNERSTFLSAAGEFRPETVVSSRDPEPVRIVGTLSTSFPDEGHYRGGYDEEVEEEPEDDESYGSDSDSMYLQEEEEEEESESEEEE